MTWKEFVEEVEKQMKEKGIPETETIWYIDISYPTRVRVCLNPNSGIEIM